MKSEFFRFSVVPGSFLLGSILICGGCGSYQAPPPISVAIAPASVAVGTGQTTQFMASVNNDTSGVMWTATAGTIDANGNYTAPTGSQSSAATITATSKKDSTKLASASVNVIAPGVVAPTANVQVALFTISPPAAAKVS